MVDLVLCGCFRFVGDNDMLIMYACVLCKRLYDICYMMLFLLAWFLPLGHFSCTVFGFIHQNGGAGRGGVMCLDWWLTYLIDIFDEISSTKSVIRRYFQGEDR